MTKSLRHAVNNKVEYKDPKIKQGFKRAKLFLNLEEY